MNWQCAIVTLIPFDGEFFINSVGVSLNRLIPQENGIFGQ
jgi:hypothetical protein